MTALLLLIPGGLLLGILINYLADVLPYTRRFSDPVCAFCGTSLGWESYLQFHPCPNCGNSRRLRNWAIPILTAVILSVLWFYPARHIEFWWAILLLVYFAVVAIIDLEYRAILFQTSVVGAVIGLDYGVVHHGWLWTLVGGAAGYGVMLVLYYLGGLFGRYMAHRQGVEIDEEALGFGDVNLTGIIGLILGWPAITAGLFAGILFAGLIGAGILVVKLLTKRYHAGIFLPYAPFLILGAVFVLFPPW